MKLLIRFERAQLYEYTLIELVESIKRLLEKVLVQRARVASHVPI